MYPKTYYYAEQIELIEDCKLDNMQKSSNRLKLIIKGSKLSMLVLADMENNYYTKCKENILEKLYYKGHNLFSKYVSKEVNRFLLESSQLLFVLDR